MSMKWEGKGFMESLPRIYAIYTGGFLAFFALMAVLEQFGLSARWIGILFVLFTLVVYAFIGVLSRTTAVEAYYVAGRSVPPVFNGMATAADWMSGASFVAMAGGVFMSGHPYMAFIVGWTGGYILIATLMAPYLRKFGCYTVPDFIGTRYGGRATRLAAIVVLIVASFTYVTAQITATGTIAARAFQIPFEIGVWLGLLGILVCSMLGGMRAVTWTQVAQYIILIIAYMIPVVWLSVKHTGIPVPQLVYGKVLEQVTAKETQLINDPKENEVRAIFTKRAADAQARLKDVPAALTAERAALQKRVDDLKASNAPEDQVRAAQDALAKAPANAEAAKEAWTKDSRLAARGAPMLRHAEAFPGKDEAARDTSRRNFLALVFCLMVGTAALPHILMRYYTTPSVKEARDSVFWSLFFIFLLYFTAPALAVLVKYDIYTLLVGTAFSKLPQWVAAWQQVDPSLLSLVDSAELGGQRQREVAHRAYPADGVDVDELHAAAWSVSMAAASPELDQAVRARPIER